jgi:hypothetical protein
MRTTSRKSNQTSRATERRITGRSAGGARTHGDSACSPQERVCPKTVCICPPPEQLFPELRHHCIAEDLEGFQRLLRGA